MVDYYKTLGLQQSASASEIKSAYRRLARTHHPDHNAGSEAAAREFALISLAYRTLSDPHERAFYDHQRARVHSGFTSSSVLDSNNVHARRMRRVATQARLNRVVDSWIEEGRRETFALQQAVFPTVTLFLSTFFAVMLKPRFWEGSTYFGRAVLFTLFLIGLWHLVSRWRISLERYTYRPKKIQDSLMQEEERPDKPFTRFTAYSFLVAAFFASIAAGYFLGEQIHYVILSDMPFFFDQHMRPDHLFYPPIAVLIVDSMHALAAKIDLSL